MKSKATFIFSLLATFIFSLYSKMNCIIIPEKKKKTLRRCQVPGSDGEGREGGSKEAPRSARREERWRRRELHRLANRSHWLRELLSSSLSPSSDREGEAEEARAVFESLTASGVHIEAEKEADRPASSRFSCFFSEDCLLSSSAFCRSRLSKSCSALRTWARKKSTLR